MWIRTWILTGILFSCLSVSAKEWLIDVRTAEEYLAEHVSGAMNIEYHRIVHEVANLGIRKYDSIQLYCRSGRRAEIARKALIKQGFHRVTNLGSVVDGPCCTNRGTI
ncbi:MULTISPECIES: rhodanese-like domain-containing protein [unclassified Aeromonas]|nr:MULTISPECIES: rhodanese-like domain-containing protein [unclassified Aeromonas]